MKALVCYDNDAPVAVLDSYEQVAEWFGVSVATAHFFKTPAHMRRNPARYVVIVDDEEDG